VFGLLIIAAYRGKLSDSQESVWKRLWGTGVLAIMLGIVADIAPQVAGPFSLLILVGSVTNGGDKALHNFLDRVSGGSTGTTPSGATGPATKPTHNKPPAGATGPTGPPPTHNKPPGGATGPTG
jgi:hypothetical protein